ncbi:MAG: polysaccharide export protein [Proteobacteria bacterium]|nr:polysaccharide export protein [Pseudomonadota bacterium]
MKFLSDFLSRLLSVKFGRQIAAAFLLTLGLAACDPDAPMSVNTLQQPSQNTQTIRMAEYRLAPGDRIRVIVLSDPELSAEYEVDSAGMISVRMAGRQQVVGMTTTEVEELLRNRYRADNLLRVARLSVDLVARRPFYVLGEVGKPGSFPYVSGINVAQAVAIAGGFTRRASKVRMTIQRFNQTRGMEETVTEDTPLGPGDILRVPERWF